jgi:hypothetical protein
MWCDWQDIDYLATCGSPCVYSGLSWALLRVAESCKNIQMPNVLNTTDGTTKPEIREKNKFEITLLISDVCVALVLIWCSVVKLYVWN